MKKVLFATTALIATAGVATAQSSISGHGSRSADIQISGWGEMGIYGGTGMETQFFTDIDVTFNMSGSTDNGLTFGASVDLDEGGAGSAAVANNADDGGATFFLSGGFGTLTMGDTDGALDWAMTEVRDGPGSINSDQEHGGWNGNSRGDGMYDGQILRYDNSFGDFAFAVSAEIDDTGAGDAVFGIGVRYGADLGGVDLNFGLGFQDYATDEMWGISIDANFGNGLGLTLNYSDLGDSDAGGVAETHTAIGVEYAMDAFSVGLNYGLYEEGATDQDGFGLTAAYNLGGGASVQFGYGSTDTCGVYSGCTVGDTWSLGVRMNF